MHSRRYDRTYLKNAVPSNTDDSTRRSHEFCVGLARTALLWFCASSARKVKELLGAGGAGNIFPAEPGCVNSR